VRKNEVGGESMSFRHFLGTDKVCGSVCNAFGKVLLVKTILGHFGERGGLEVVGQRWCDKRCGGPGVGDGGKELEIVGQGLIKVCWRCGERENEVLEGGGEVVVVSGGEQSVKIGFILVQFNTCKGWAFDPF